MSWVSFTISLIGLVNSIVKMLERKQMMTLVEDAAVAKAALEVLESTKTGKELREKVVSLSDDEAARLWERMVQ